MKSNLPDDARDDCEADSREQPGSTCSRRMLLLGGGLAFAAVAAIDDVHAAVEASASAAGQVRLLMRIMASIREERVPWYYSGRIYAMRGSERPVPLYDFEGAEIYWVRQEGADSWSIASSTLTFYRDLATGNYIETFLNPLNGKSVESRPSVLRTVPGKRAMFSPGKMLVLGENSPLDVSIERNADVAWVTSRRSADRAPQPSLSSSTMFASVRDVDNPRKHRLTSTFSSMSYSPWPRWLEMGDAQGYLVWHAAGRKLDSLEQLPADYRRRADAQEKPHFSDPDTAITPS